MKSTSSSSSGSSREERKQLPNTKLKLTVSDTDVAITSSTSLLPDSKSESGFSRKNSKSSLKSHSPAASTADANNTKDEIIASMIKDRMRELELREDFAAPQSSCTSIDQQSLFPDAAANTATTSNGDSTTDLLIKASPSRSPGNSDESHQEHGSSVSRRPHGIERKYSRSHQRRFHRRFPTVAADEMLIDWFNCALIADILLQGYLYISDNHFAFYSNIFGYKTQFLIPIANVVSVTKEKTAKIFPNAVGICTDEAKYVFGSLISRESAYRLLQDVWRSTLYQVASDSCDDRMKKMRDSQAAVCALNPSDGASTRTASGTKLSDDDSDDDSGSDSEESDAAKSTIALTHSDQKSPESVGIISALSTHMKTSIKKNNNNCIFVLVAVVLVLLFVSAACLLFRANFLYSRLTALTESAAADTHLPAGSGSADLDEVTGTSGDSDGLWHRTRAAILSWNRVKSFSGKIQHKLREVSDLRHELEQLLTALKSDNSPSY